MKAEGSAQSSDAQYVRENCIQTQQVGLVELITPEVLRTLKITFQIVCGLCGLRVCIFWESVSVALSSALRNMPP